MHLHTNVAAKFKDEEPVPFSLHFFFFQYVCLAMVNPDKYDLVQGETFNEFTRSGLLNVSKLLKALAGQTGREGDHPLLLEYQKKNGMKIYDIFKSLIDAKAIDTAERILLANTSTVKINPEQVQYLKERFIHFLQSNNLDDAISLPESSESSNLAELESPEMFAKMTQMFEEKINSPAWKQKKKKSSIEVCVMKDENESTISVRVEVLCAAPLEETAEFFIQNYFSSKFDAGAFDWKIKHQSNNYHEHYFRYKLPFPMSNRDFSFGQWLVYEKDRILDIRNSNKTYPPQPGYIRATGMLQGIEFIRVTPTEGAFLTRVRSFAHADPGGSIPKWLVNSLALGQAEKVVRMKREIESKYKHPLRTESETSSMSSLSSS